MRLTPWNYIGQQGGRAGIDKNKYVTISYRA